MPLKKISLRLRLYGSICKLLKRIRFVTTELATATVKHVYRGKFKKVVNKVLKEIKGHYKENNLNFFICNQVVKYKYKSPLVNSLQGYF